jgi:hypothetical protein
VELERSGLFFSQKEIRVENKTSPLHGMSSGISYPWYRQRWWLRSREIRRNPDPKPGEWIALGELYVPWWAKPLDRIHTLVFGNIKLDPVEQD